MKYILIWIIGNLTWTIMVWIMTMVYRRMKSSPTKSLITAFASAVTGLLAVSGGYAGSLYAPQENLIVKVITGAMVFTTSSFVICLLFSFLFFQVLENFRFEEYLHIFIEAMTNATVLIGCLWFITVILAILW